MSVCAYVRGRVGVGCGGMSARLCITYIYSIDKYIHTASQAFLYNIAQHDLQDETGHAGVQQSAESNVEFDSDSDRARRRRDE